MSNEFNEKEALDRIFRASFFAHPLMGLPKKPLWESWTGRILLVNMAVFIAMVFESQSLWLPDIDTLQRYGVKDSAALIRGEWWRLITPIFVHIGFLHFIVNSFALYYLGPSVESFLGGRWFLLTYLVSGLGGCIAGAVFSLGLSAGASGALFGILGVGFIAEMFAFRQFKKMIRDKLGAKAFKEIKKQVKIPLPYRALVLINILLGFFLSFGAIRVDQMAHLGGLFCGCFLAFIHREWQFALRHSFLRRWGVQVAIALFSSALTYGGILALSAEFYKQKIDALLERVEDLPQQKLEILSEGIRVFPEEANYRYYRGKFFAEKGEKSLAKEDFEAIPDFAAFKQKSIEDIQDLRRRGHGYAAEQFADFLRENSYLDPDELSLP